MQVMTRPQPREMRTTPREIRAAVAPPAMAAGNDQSAVSEQSAVADIATPRMIGKRAFDLVVGSVLALAAVPLILVMAVAVAISLRTCRPFFFQQRLGRGGLRFTVPKLRTLPVHAPRSADKYAIASVRTTRLGAFLRRTHLDEIPQLLLVPSGRMSLVGPRPEMPWLLEKFDADFVAARLAVRPGCTGLWQVSNDYHKLIGETPEYDLYYVANAKVRLDVWVLLRTVAMTVAGSRARISGCDALPAWAGGRGSGVRRASKLRALEVPGTLSMATDGGM